MSIQNDLALAALSLTEFPFLLEFESSQVTEKKRTVYQMALSKGAHVCLWVFPLSLSSTSIECVPSHTLFLRFVAVCISVLLPCVSLLSSPLLFPSVCLSVPSSPVSCLLSDKLDEILAAAQQTISTNEAPGTRGQGPKRDRGRSFYGNEVSMLAWKVPFCPEN